MSRSKSRSEGSIGGRLEERRAAFVCSGVFAVDGEEGLGRGGKADWGRGGIEWRPM